MRDDVGRDSAGRNDAVRDGGADGGRRERGPLRERVTDRGTNPFDSPASANRTDGPLIALGVSIGVALAGVAFALLLLYRYG